MKLSVSRHISPSMTNEQASHGLVQWHGTTIVGIKRGDKTVVAGDGQVSMGNTVMKPNARKVRRIGSGGKVVAGFAGATRGAFPLFERLEAKLEQYSGQLLRASVELAKVVIIGCRRRSCRLRNSINYEFFNNFRDYR